MKKNAVKFSGILTSIISFLIFVLLLVVLLSILGLDIFGSIFDNQIIPNSGYFILILPLESVLRLHLGLDWEYLGTVLVVLGVLLSLIMFIWGIKEATLAKKNDANFARCKKTCAFMMVVKFFSFLYPLVIILLSVLFNEVSILLEFFGVLLGYTYIPLIILIFLAIVALINFLIPVVSFSKAARFLKESSDPSFYEQNEGALPAEADMGEGQMQQEFEEGPVYQAPYYNNPQSQPIEANTLFQPEDEYEGDVIRIIPGRDGVPVNITQKGINDLMRLERLRASKTIDEKNYVVMKEKICSLNIY